MFYMLFNSLDLKISNDRNNGTNLDFSDSSVHHYDSKSDETETRIL